MIKQQTNRIEFWNYNVILDKTGEYFDCNNMMSQMNITESEVENFLFNNPIVKHKPLKLPFIKEGKKIFIRRDILPAFIMNFDPSKYYDWTFQDQTKIDIILNTLNEIKQQLSPDNATKPINNTQTTDIVIRQQFKDYLGPIINGVGKEAQRMNKSLNTIKDDIKTIKKEISASTQELNRVMGELGVDIKTMQKVAKREFAYKNGDMVKIKQDAKTGKFIIKLSDGSIKTLTMNEIKNCINIVEKERPK